MRARHRFLRILSLLQAVAVALVAAVASALLAPGTGYAARDTGGTSGGGAGSGLVGLNAPNQGRVYIAGWDQQSVRASDPAQPFRSAAAAGMSVVRVFTWDAVTTRRWLADPEGALADLRRMCDDAAAAGVRLVLSPRLEEEDIEVLAGHPFASWRDARAAIATPGDPARARFAALLAETAATLRDHPGVQSMEVVNEPPFMLGMDDGSISVDAGVAFMKEMLGVLKAGGARTNVGSWPMWNPDLLNDRQVVDIHVNADVIDAHFYPPDPADPVASSSDQARRLAAEHAAFVERVRRLLNRPAMPAMIGELGTAPWQGWHNVLLEEALAHGWTVLTWGYDAYDLNAFNDTHRPEVLGYLAKKARQAMAPPLDSPSGSCLSQPISERYAALDGAEGLLGAPLTCELPTPQKEGRYADFAGGSIYWSSATGAWTVHGEIREAWRTLGGSSSLLGFPVTNEQQLPGGTVSRFQHGRISWSPSTGAHETHGAILGAWAANGYESGRLGYPLTDETPTTRPGAYNHFERGSIYWSPESGAHVIEGAIRGLWTSLGAENSDLGFPVSDEYDVPGGRRSDFQHGAITWTPKGGAMVA